MVMGLPLDPSISTKVSKMRSRVRWQAPQLCERGIDQTRLAIADEPAERSAFSFLVIGDSGFGPQSYGHPQREVAQYLATQQADCQFLLHTGDVVYSTGAPEQYPANFIHPYQEWLVGGDTPENLSYDRLTFQKPFLTVPGNHDYYNLPYPYGLIMTALQPLRGFLNLPMPNSLSLQGSVTGSTYARAFLDYLQDLPESQLAAHLDQHYTTDTDTGRCLTYQPGQFTRLPNRYYQFCYGDIDFFALDSSTFNRPVAVNGATLLAGDTPIPDLEPGLDWEQLFWLRDRLVVSLQNPAVRGRILFFHHPPYVTEVTKLREQACLCCRRHLRWVLDSVAERVGPSAPRPLVNLTLNGHAHCFEYLRSLDTGHADSHLNWVICGGSGARVRSQNPDYTTVKEEEGSHEQIIAKSQIFVGRHEGPEDTHWPYSFLRIDVQPDKELKLIIRPFVAELYQDSWQRSELPSLVL